MKRTAIRRKRATPRRREAPRWDASDWEAANAVLMARCGGRCEKCGHHLAGRVERAHRVRRRDGGDRLSNILMLHPECHAATHASPLYWERFGFILPTHLDPLTTPVLWQGSAWSLLDDDGGRTECEAP